MSAKENIKRIMRLFPGLFEVSGDGSVYFAGALKGILTDDSLRIDAFSSTSFHFEYIINSYSTWKNRIIFRELGLGVKYTDDGHETFGSLALKSHLEFTGDLGTIIPDHICMELFNLGINIAYPEFMYSLDDPKMVIATITKTYDQASITRRYAIANIIK